ncbi:uncharacterized protein LOC125374058 [Haliotis rufescens]|uniref:uncharacterized protein LOC125374058 n=1 Tax=Haliotis rufescens TaxID=6454 RepID=UPI00201F439D|nr:uncharacterized protein LOC125374058 [Haliotis rufescens]XP_048240758.1 uncharacterized protein LOC125374058 [Haliotis rufescens]XP_048240759.1 uncharacterized protein LOC125374058 [Haliotis rufescens]XP_048240760.1 uncharacterized protein LOC125374058 [Haliotis rufescens]XP_048240761.1 uncharacterized protein LOC125374058 [Haliotis rufescens]XP_048240762.1 uncharacterized protein LOC125374058 [Haliotis rufescens]XP_048240763.1 uncharacterized protein LOC125374058 [Haliotis rufescens]XP_0
MGYGSNDFHEKPPLNKVGQETMSTGQKTHRRVQNGGDSADVKPVRLKLGQNTAEPDTSQLSFEQMWELQRVTDKRVKNRVSEGLSPEGKMAMEQAKTELELSRKDGRIKNGALNRTITDSQNSNHKKRGKVKKQISFVDAYESSSASRLSGDLLDESSGDRTQRRRALGGGNVCVAMETVEIVSYGETPSDSEADDIAIEETAKLNSVEKCLVWMGVHSQEG